MIHVTELMPQNNGPTGEVCILLSSAPKENCPITGLISELVELHNFAERIGLKTQWYQPKYFGYTITPGKRAQALREGAQEITREQWAEITKDWRQKTSGRRSFQGPPARLGKPRYDRRNFRKLH
jgi:hypothetical protein